MALPPPVLDHVVIDVRERIDEAERAFTALGFTLTPRGHHTLGSANHLAMFATDYLELLGFGAAGAARPELASFPVGLNGLVFKTDDADSVHAHAEAAHLPILPVQSFSRPVELAGGRQDARFRTTRLDPARIAMGRVYFCEHLTPELVWRPEWQTHPNRACAISRVIVATDAPPRTAALFAALFGPAAIAERDGACVIAAGTARVELIPPGRIAEEFGDAAADPAGRSEYLAGLEFRVAVPAGRRVVPARNAFNTTLAFSP
jgi:hypothetical protein